MIIYYEDLINDCDKVLIELCKFIPDIKTDYFLDFLKNKDHHCYLSSNGKNRSWGGSNSNGEIGYHFKNASLTEKKIIIGVLKNFRKHHTELFRKYLKIYKEEKSEIQNILEQINEQDISK